ncbi:MAG: SUMF1/EgtB/PvdO family nonheme iron enzyme [Symploca sp. SIO2E6]|nr:SUMF1/EgtB/PvdO family nonheme iron enzyme [Symploca sp. SIO2E6]
MPVSTFTGTDASSTFYWHRCQFHILLAPMPVPHFTGTDASSTAMIQGNTSHQPDCESTDNLPQADDAVLGGEVSPPVGSVILGGIEGVRQRLRGSAVEQRLMALQDALNYGETGLELVIEALQDQSPEVQFTAHLLLIQQQEPKIKQQLNNKLLCSEFEVVSIDAQGMINSRYNQQTPCLAADLDNGIIIEMVAIPQGKFLMGSRETEEGHRDSESPQHQVTIKPFFMGKYPVTQAQWQAVAALPEVNRSLNHNPSKFKGANLPVEQVSWYDAMEFCDRLSQKTGWQYRLPSEAEWEYACRAGTTTPFHFGETITTDVANYYGICTELGHLQGLYGEGPPGISLEKTTPVGSFGVANNFGLYDMHGNVAEWCADSWHSSYQGAPTDGSVWQEKNNQKNRFRMLRGGSWGNIPGNCRCAFRNLNDPGSRHISFLGFRVVCVS